MPKFIYVKFKTMFDNVTKTTLSPDIDESYQIKTLINTIENVFGDTVAGYLVTDTDIDREEANVRIGK